MALDHISEDEEADGKLDEIAEGIQALLVRIKQLVSQPPGVDLSVPNGKLVIEIKSNSVDSINRF